MLLRLFNFSPACKKARCHKLQLQNLGWRNGETESKWSQRAQRSKVTAQVTALLIEEAGSQNQKIISWIRSLGVAAVPGTISRESNGEKHASDCILFKNLSLGKPKVNEGHKIRATREYCIPWHLLLQQTEIRV